MRVLCVGLVLASFLGPAVAEESAGPELALARQFVVALEAPDDEARQAAVRQADSVDPWLVADQLIAMGRGEAAARWAAAFWLPLMQGLPAYVKASRGRDDAAVRAALSSSAASASDPKAVLEQARALKVPYHSVAAIRLMHARGLALLRRGQADEGARVLMVAGEAAARIGWLLRADVLLKRAAATWWQAQSWRLCLGAFEARLEVARRAKAARVEAALFGNIGVVRMRMGDLQGAVDAIEQAAAAHVARGDDAMLVGALQNLGTAQWMSGHLQQAQATFERTLHMLRDRGDERRIGSALNSLGVVRTARGDLAGAFSAYERALRIARRLHDRDATAAALNNLGLVHARVGEHDRAKALFEEALTIRNEQGDRLRQGQLHNNLALVYQAQEDWQQVRAARRKALALGEALGDPQVTIVAYVGLALAHRHLGEAEAEWAALERALAVARRVGWQTHVAELLVNMGVARSRQQKIDEAIALQRQALAVAEEVAYPYAQAQALTNLSGLMLRQGEPMEALSYADRAVTSAASQVQGLSDQQGAQARELWARPTELGVAAAAQLGEASDLLRFLERGRAGTLLESLGAGARVREVGLPDELRHAEHEARVHEQRAELALRQARSQGARRQIRAARRALGAARGALHDAIARIQREAKRAAAIVYPQPDDLKAVKARLAPGEALVLYALTPHAVALVIEPRGERIVELGPASKIRSACHAFLLSESPWVAEDQTDPLRELLATPLALGEHVQHVHVSPQGIVGYVPFAMFFGTRSVSYLPSATTLGVLRSMAPGRGSGVLGVGDPAYDMHPGASRLRRLPGSRKEVERVATVKLLAEAATEAGFRRALDGKHWRAIHLACHGLVDPEHPQRSALALTPDASGAGTLSCLDVFGLGLEAELVVLSACETGKGRIYKAEGIVGLTRAFMFAGAPRVICSLWKVDDEATQALMVRFYELWLGSDSNSGMPAAKALREAQAFVRGHEKWRHPNYWAGWVLWGLPN